MKICVIGLGYVGIVLADALGAHYPVIGFDIDQSRILELSSGLDRTCELDLDSLVTISTKIHLTSEESDLCEVDCFIVAVPTPVDSNNEPDLKSLIAATKTVGRSIRNGGLVIYESTVWPGCTEQICLPILEEVSGLRVNEGIFLGYSPERINPGDKCHTLRTVTKIVSGSNEYATAIVESIYSNICDSVYVAESIRVAEAAKIIENTQRDINIALMNELAIIFSKFNISCRQVLNAARTKWNFLPYEPGLVGGHCIGVDPYYLTYKAKEVGYSPALVLAGREVNEAIPSYIFKVTMDRVSSKSADTRNRRVSILICGLTFKENIPDARNSKALDLYKLFRDAGCNVYGFDPHLSASEVAEISNFSSIESINIEAFDAIIFAVKHTEICQGAELLLSRHASKNTVVIDVKGILGEGLADYSFS